LTNTRAPRRPEVGDYSIKGIASRNTRSLNCVVTKFPRAPRRLEIIFPRNPLYFVTCCTYRRRPYLANDRVHETFVKFSKYAHNDFGIAVGHYVVLPDHLHLFVALPDDFKLGDWIGTLKRVLGRSLEDCGAGDPIWQRGFFDHLLRSSESYTEKWNYVHENPVRAGLVSHADDWPFSGEIVNIYFD
jgi:REP element-mobilizing transposase RayT